MFPENLGLLLKRVSISVSFSLVLLAMLLLVSTAVLVGLHQFRVQMLRNEAQTVANQVVAFRSWVAQAGMVWVNQLAVGFHDYLAVRSGEDGQLWYGKNPALATRELSEIVKTMTKRTSFRVVSDEVRQIANTPDPFESRAISEIKSNPENAFFEGFENGEYRYAEPVFVTKACLKCHGDPRDAPKEVIEKYGAEKAFGYQAGEVRGIISVRLPDLTWWEILPSLANSATLALFAAAILLGYLYLRLDIIRPLRGLIQSAEAPSEGPHDAGWQSLDPTSPRNELTRLDQAIRRLREPGTRRQAG
jgi:hypothetical protein